MESYIKSVMTELELPRAVRADIRRRLEEEILLSRQRGESFGVFLERRGPAADVAREYNEAYRAATNKKRRNLNIGIAFLCLLLILSGFLLGKHLFDYASERIQFEQARLLMAQVAPQQPNQRAAQEGFAPFSGAQYNANQYTPAQSPFTSKVIEEAAYTVRLDMITVVSYSAVMILCLIGVNVGVHQKEELKKRRHYIQITPDFSKQR